MLGRVSAIGVAVISAAGLFGAVSSTANAAVVFDQSGSNLTKGSPGISSRVIADDFQIGSKLTLSSFAVEISDYDANDNGVIDTFSGTLGWAIYENDAINAAPGALLVRGSRSGAELTVTDTGQDEFDAYDVAIVSGNFSPNLTLAAGTYWLAIREGAWGSDFDGSDITWMPSLTNFGSAYVGDGIETVDEGFWSSSEDGGTAFTISAVPEPTTLGLLAATASLALRRRTRAAGH